MGMLTLAGTPAPHLDGSALDADALVADGVKNLYEAAAFLGISRPTLYRLMDEGALAYLHVGCHRKIPVAELRRYLRAQLAAAGGAA